MGKLKETLCRLNDKLIEVNKVLDGKVSTYNFFNNVVSRLRNTVTKENNTAKNILFDINLNNDTNIMNLMSNELNNINLDDNNEDEECGICMDVISEDNVGVTKCGHIFCYECLEIAIKNYHNCPMCKKRLKDNEIFILSFERKKKHKK